MSTLGNTTRVVMGAGKWYAATWTSGAIDPTTIAIDDNLIGYTSGGATVTYTPETYTIEDDIGMVKRTFMTKASTSMKTGLLTFDTKSLAALLSVGAVTEQAATSSARGTTTLKLGGGREELKRFNVVFEYTDTKTTFKTYVGMTATNIAPVTMTFGKDKETIVELEFVSASNGTDENSVTFVEETSEKST